MIHCHFVIVVCETCDTFHIVAQPVATLVALNSYVSCGNKKSMFVM